MWRVDGKIKRNAPEPGTSSTGGKELQSRAEAAIPITAPAGNRTDGMRTTHRPETCEPADETHKRRPPERNSIYAGYQYFRICQPQATLPKNRNWRAEALFPNRNPKTPPAHAARVKMTIRTGSLITTSDWQGIGLLTGRNHKPTPRPRLMKALTSRAGRRRNPPSSLHTIQLEKYRSPIGTGRKGRVRN